MPQEVRGRLLAYLYTVSKWLSLKAFLEEADIGVHVVRISRVIIDYTLESSSSLA